MKTCCFIGHRYIDNTQETEERVKETVEKLIGEGVTDFLFGSKSEFDAICLKTVTALKEKYPYITRTYVRAEYEYISEQYYNYLLESYDSSYFAQAAHNAGRLSYVKRNREMIDKSDICVFYYDRDYTYRYRSSGTQIAFDYAVNKKKKIINIFE